jgi:hypothetical protein
MSLGLPYLLAASLFAPTQPPADAEKIAVDVLRDIHNRGAELYNSSDPAGAYRLYEGALLTVRPFLARRPDVQKLIDDGFTEVAKADGPKVRAFRLHEVIETVRDRLKGEKKDPIPTPPKPMSKVGTRPAAVGVTGSVTMDGKPAAGVEVTLVTLDLPAPRVFNATAADGTFAFPDGLPPGKYVVMVTPMQATAVPERYRTTGTSGITIAVAPGANSINLDLKSK